MYAVTVGPLLETVCTPLRILYFTYPIRRSVSLKIRSISSLFLIGLYDSAGWLFILPLVSKYLFSFIRNFWLTLFSFGPLHVTPLKYH